MSLVAGPIDFASDGPRDDKGPTEFGGVAGLIQPDVVGGVDAHIEMSADEKRGVLVRAQAPRVYGTIEDVPDVYVIDGEADAVDPVSGRVVDPEWNEDGSKPTTVTDVPPKTEKP